MTIEVKYVDHYGSDLMVANAARKSFGKGYDTFRTIEEGPRFPNGRSDEELIIDLVAQGHWLPFRHPHITVEGCVPIPIARQLGKHQVGMEWSEISRRYKIKDITFHHVNGEWRSDVEDRRQGSGGNLIGCQQDQLDCIQERNIINCLRDYKEALSVGAAPEQARFLLPQSMEVLWTWTGSLLAFAHLFHQRSHQDTQKETRDFANIINSIIEPLYPVSWKELRK
jgi:thymidylate synthase (FAD)